MERVLTYMILKTKAQSKTKIGLPAGNGALVAPSHRAILSLAFFREKQ